MARKDELPFGKELPFGVESKPTTDELSSSFSSLVNPREAIVKNARMVLVDLPVDPVRAQKVLPFGLRLEHPPTARLFVVHYERSAYSPAYHESSLMFFVRTVFGNGGHVAWMVVDNDTALILGRELLSCPKKLADIEYKQSADGVKASVTRQGVEIVSMKADIKGEEESPEYILGAKAFNVGGPGQFVALNPIWCFRLGEVIYESYEAEGTVTFNDSVYDPLERYIAEYENPVPMRVVRMDINLLRYMFPAGVAGPGWWLRTYNMRYR